MTFAAFKPGLLQGDGPELQRRGARWPTSASPSRPPRRRAGRGRRPRRLAAAPAAQVNKWTSAPWAWPPGRWGWRARPSCAPAAPWPAGAGMIRLGTPGDPPAPWPTEAVRVNLPGRGWAATSWRPRPSARPWSSGPGSGPADATRRGDPGRHRRRPGSAGGRRRRAHGPRRRARHARSSLGEPEAPRCSRPTTVSSPAWPGAPPGEDRLAAARRPGRSSGPSSS